MQVVEPTVRSRELAEEEGAPVAQAGGVVAELVARVRLRDRPCVRAGLLAGEAVVVAPRSVRLASLLRGVLPGPAFDVVVGRGFGVHSSMERFTGRG